jgi:pimeloyl-ACP methyl ester carboxylesterase
MADPISAWPGEFAGLDDAGDVYVRTAPARSVPDGADPEPAVMVHGLGGSSRNWTDLMDLLSRPGRPGEAVLTCEAVDLPGYGESPVPASGDYSIGGQADSVIAFIDRQGRWPVHLVGNSLGGAVCTRVAARRPDLVRTLTLISPAMPDLRPRILPLRVAAVSVPGIGPWALSRLETQSPRERALRSLRDVYADPALMHPSRIQEEIDEVVRRDRLGYQVQVLLGSVRSLVAEYTRRGPGNLWRDAARVTAPTLVIHGSHDRLVSPASAARAARSFRYGQAVVLPRVGHVAMMERPDLVARLMREFFVTAEPGRPDAALELNRVPN